MEKYRILEELGDGTCGCVFKAINTKTYETVAVKRMKRRFYVWEECINLRELKALRKLSHPNIINLKEVVRENNELFFIFEYMEFNLYQIMKERETPFSEEEIRNFMSQLLQGLVYMHGNGYFHRDLKPENLLVTNKLLKIADFGLAREVSSMPPYTEYVSTRWYRAPEVLLQSSTYTPAIDMWAVGALMAELFTSSPIFPGESMGDCLTCMLFQDGKDLEANNAYELVRVEKTGHSLNIHFSALVERATTSAVHEIDQLYKICCVLGTPDWHVFPVAKNISRLITISCSDIFPANLGDIIPYASPQAIDLIKRLCVWDPSKRLTAEQALDHPFFHVNMWVPHPLEDPLELKLNSIGAKPNLELNLWDFASQPDDLYLGLTLAVKPSISKLEAVPNVSRNGVEDFLLCSDFNHHREDSVFWSLLSPNEDGIHRPADQSLSLSFSPMQHPSVGVPQPSGFSMSSLQPNILEYPLLAVSSPLQQRHYL